MTDSTEEDRTPQYVFLLVFNAHKSQVLMVEEDEEWYLPYFEYKVERAQNKIDACKKLEQLLGIQREALALVAVFDAVGFIWTFMENHTIQGHSNVVLVEPQVPESDLVSSSAARWCDANFVSALHPVDEKDRKRGPQNPVHDTIFRVTHQIMTNTYTTKYLRETRCTPGWFARAAKYMNETLVDMGVQQVGHVQQCNLTSASTILKVECCSGSYFLKAPTITSSELITTKTIFEHLPHLSLNVISVNEELGCFISEEFEEYAHNEEKDIDNDFEVQTDLVDIMIKLHFESISMVPVLLENGIPDRSPDTLIKKIDSWLTNDLSLRNIQMLYFDKTFSSMAEEIKTALIYLKGIGLPLTLVHADLIDYNVGFRETKGKKTAVLYDWQFSCISHPLFEFHRIFDDFDSVSDKVIKKYLSEWTKYAPMEKLEKGLKLGCTLAWLIKMWFAVDYLNIIENQWLPFLFEFIQECLHQIRTGLKKAAESKYLTAK